MVEGWGMDLLEARRARHYTLAEAAKLMGESVGALRKQLAAQASGDIPATLTGAQLEAWKGSRWFLYACFSLTELAALSRAGYRPPELFEAAYTRAFVDSLRGQPVPELDFGLPPRPSLLEDLEEGLKGPWRRAAWSLIAARDHLQYAHTSLKQGTEQLDKAARYLYKLAELLEESLKNWPTGENEARKRMVQAVFSGFFYLHVQLRETKRELRRIGWRTDWTEADTHATLTRMLRDLGRLVAELRAELVQSVGNVPRI